MNMIVRKAEYSDLNKVEQLYQELNDHLAAHENYPGWKRDVYPTREDAEEGLRSGGLYVAENQGKIAGTVIFLYEQDEIYRSIKWQIDQDAPVIILHILAVHPDYFGCGVGKALLDHAEFLGQQQGIRAIRLDTYEKNLPAARLYEKCGFQYIGLADLGLEETTGLKWFKIYEKVLTPPPGLEACEQ
ncbi:GNAT family N-acetyltransferase [Blautia producta]|uniref:dTDP-fucosamine acetyltransferase n=1 Tax=Blautia producta TaxID=33035 RepID=A0A4P6M1F2_9FIRM|nr:GNAT family N-acetyltransferase [Blautia producta]QBE97273.1 dTDP-fucosamine acetyltransferase [Blautia producta]